MFSHILYFIQEKEMEKEKYSRHAVDIMICQMKKRKINLTKFLEKLDFAGARVIFQLKLY